MLDDKTRIKKDVVMFEENLKKLEKNQPNYKFKIIELATQYYNDSKYYFDKEDYFTSFGCINYAHGLLDAILKF